MAKKKPPSNIMDDCRPDMYFSSFLCKKDYCESWQSLDPASTVMTTVYFSAAS